MENGDKVMVVKDIQTGSLMKTTKSFADRLIRMKSHVPVPKKKLKAFLNKEEKLANSKHNYNVQRQHTEIIGKKPPKIDLKDGKAVYMSKNSKGEDAGLRVMHFPNHL